MPGADVATQGNRGEELNLLFYKYACIKPSQASKMEVSLDLVVWTAYLTIAISAQRSR